METSADVIEGAAADTALRPELGPNRVLYILVLVTESSTTK